MADTSARRRYVGKTRPVAIKQLAQEDSGAHPDHVGVDDRVGGSMERKIDDHSSCGGASNVDGEVQVAVVDKLVKQ